MSAAPDTRMRRPARALWACLAGTVLLTAVDLWTKRWAEDELARAREGYRPAVCAPDPDGHWYFQRVRTRSIVLIEGYLEFRYAENCGAAFGMLDRSPAWVRAGVFLSAAVVAVGALLWMFFTANGGPLFAWSVPLIVSGAIGNMVDRLSLGYVVDFIRFHVYDKFEYPTFNVADSTITIGVALILIDGFMGPKSRPTGPAAPGASDTSSAPG
jgi:signal peptidase II